MISEEEFERLMDTLRLLEKSKNMAEFYANTRELTNDEKILCESSTWVDQDSFQELNDDCLYKALKFSSEAEASMAKAKYCVNYVKGLYKHYKEREAEIKHPAIIKFIKDYEEYYKGDEK